MHHDPRLALNPPGVSPVPVPAQHPSAPDVVDIGASSGPDQRARHVNRHGPSLSPKAPAGTAPADDHGSKACQDAEAVGAGAADDAGVGGDPVEAVRAPGMDVQLG